MKTIMYKRINSKLFTLVHYLGVIFMLYYPYIVRILGKHAERTCTSEQDDEPCPYRMTKGALYTFLIVLIFYMAKNVIGYLVSILFMYLSFGVISESVLFDFAVIDKNTGLSDNFIAMGFKYFELFTKIGQGVMRFLFIMLLWALYFAIKRYLYESKQKNEPVNPELEMERRNQ